MRRTGSLLSARIVEIIMNCKAIEGNPEEARIPQDPAVSPRLCVIIN